MTTTQPKPTPEETRLVMATDAYESARHEQACALSELLRLELLKFSEEHPEVKGLAFETEWCYDDEGGYFMADTVYPLTDGEPGFLAEMDEDPYEFSDAMHGFGHTALTMLCGLFPDDTEGQVTVEQAREMRF